MNLTVKCSAVLVILLCSAGTPKAQTFVKVHSYPIYFGGGKLDLILWKCSPPDSYFIQAANMSEATPLDCSTGQLSSDLLEQDLTYGVRSLIRNYHLLDLSPDKGVNDYRVDSLLNDRYFNEQLHNHYPSIRDAVAPPKPKPTGKSTQQKKSQAKTDKKSSSKTDKSSSTSGKKDTSQGGNANDDNNAVSSNDNGDNNDAGDQGEAQADNDDDTDKDPKSSKADSSILDNITLLNAFNFDFANKLSTSYLGLFNVFAPQAFSKNFGVIAGIERITYGNGTINNNDSVHTYYTTQNIVNPFDITRSGAGGTYLRDSAMYHQRFTKYTYSSTNTLWSFYLEPIIRIHHFSYTDNEKEKNTGVFLHGHLELLINEWTRKTDLTIVSDTLRMATPTPLYNVVYAPTDKIVSNVNFTSGYFGVGVSAYFRPFPGYENTHMYFQGTLGFAIKSPNFDSLNYSHTIPHPNGDLPFQPYNNTTKGFYLIRTSFLRNLSSKSQLVVGFTIRGLLPTTDPQYAAYIGLNLGLNALTDLFSGDK